MCNIQAGNKTSYPAREEKHWAVFFWSGLLMLTLFRIWFLGVFPYDLSPDEAYYWDWSRHLSWGYYSKPPMVAWVIALFSSALGSSEFSVRLPATLFSCFALAGLYSLGSRMYGSRTGLFSALVFFATVGSAVSSMIMTIDAPLLCFWSISMAALWRAWQCNAASGWKSKSWWAAAGAATGLGLLSKQTMAAFTVGVVLFLFSSARGRKRLFTPGPYLYLAIQILMVLPVLAWNHHHGWVTLQHTAHHFEPVPGEMKPNLKTFFELLGTQAGVVTPVTFILAILVSSCFLWKVLTDLLRGWSREKGTHDREVFLLFLGILPLAAVFLLSLRQRINANWPAPFYLSLGVLLSAWAFGKVTCDTGLDKLRRFYLPGIGIGVFMVAVLYLLPFLLGFFNIAGSGLDPTVRLKGWHELGTEAGRVLHDFPRPDKTFVVARRRQTVSTLAFYMPGRPEVYRWNGARRHISTQYELWPGPADKKGWDALIILEKDKVLLKDLVACFKGVQFVRQIDIPLGHGLKRSFLAYRGVEMRHWSAR